MSEEAAPEVEQDDSVVSSPETSAPDVSEPQVDAPGVEAQADPWTGFRQLPEFQGLDDQQIAANIYERMQREEYASRALQQYQSIVPIASEYLSNRDLYEQWKANRGAPQAPNAPQQQISAVPQQEQAAGWWNPPKIRDAYRQYLVRDEHGREVIAENAPLDAKHALSEYQTYKAEFARKFLENPQEALGPMIEGIVQQKAQEIATGQIDQLKEESFIAELERANKDWLYDEAGRASREGVLVQKYIDDARQMGINGARQRWDYAVRMVERDMLLNNFQMARSQQAPAPQPAQPPSPPPQADAAQRNMDYLRQQAVRTAPRRATSGTTDARQPQKPMTFAERLAQNLRASGLSDSLDS